METKEIVREIPSKSANFSDWYTAVVLKAELADYAPMRGMTVFRPYGYAIWELMQAALDRRFKETGHANAYFPLFIPRSFLEREAEHVAGFAPEVAWVTHGGKEQLSEWLAVRPTSEAIIGHMYAKWIQSYRDLPILINQWNNVVRWEKSTRFFLRTMEFLWQEGHTAHRTAQEAEEETWRMLRVYEDFVTTELAVPVLAGRKPDSEKFAGAIYSLTIEAMMPDGQALQSGTSHFFGTNFARAFGIQFLDADNTRKYVSTTSWGLSWRALGATIMTHGDDRGLFLPPRIAPIQVVVVPIRFEQEPSVRDAARSVAAELAGRMRVRLDEREAYTPGWKFNDWEMRGVPLRVEIGPKELRAHQAILVARDGQGGRRPVPLDGVADAAAAELGAIQSRMYERAKAFLDSQTLQASTFDEAVETIGQRRGFVRVLWCRDAACENRLREATGASPRVITDEPADGVCVACGRPAVCAVYFARAY
ncbi:MAG: proline--tRNA ligase [Armatimonadota bacterium]|nr:proline--tRNA ligase [Armatimonadota bacterium]MDR5696284.1 proline--tRNA ligase [Armatimonadota bacterium]